MTNVIGRHVAAYADAENPGDFWFRPGYSDRVIMMLSYLCPQCGELRCVPISLSPATNRWDWDGEYDRPTLKPSIRQMDGCQWHGWLTKGIWVTA